MWEPSILHCNLCSSWFENSFSLSGSLEATFHWPRFLWVVLTLSLSSFEMLLCTNDTRWSTVKIKLKIIYFIFISLEKKDGKEEWEGDPFTKCVLTIIVSILYLLFGQLFQLKKKKRLSWCVYRFLVPNFSQNISLNINLEHELVLHSNKKQ